MLIKVTFKKIWKNVMTTNVFFPKLSLITVFDEKNIAQNNSVKSQKYIASRTLLLNQNRILGKM